MRKNTNLTKEEYEKWHRENMLCYFIQFLEENNKLNLLLDNDYLIFAYTKEEFAPMEIIGCYTSEDNIEFNCHTKKFTREELILEGIPALRVVMQDSIELNERVADMHLRERNEAYKQRNMAYEIAARDIFKIFDKKYQELKGEIIKSIG